MLQRPDDYVSFSVIEVLFYVGVPLAVIFALGLCIGRFMGFKEGLRERRALGSPYRD